MDRLAGMDDLGETVVEDGGFRKHLVQRAEAGRRRGIRRYREQRGGEDRPRLRPVQPGQAGGVKFRPARIGGGLGREGMAGRQREEQPAARMGLARRRFRQVDGDGVDQPGGAGDLRLAQQPG